MFNSLKSGLEAGALLALASIALSANAAKADEIVIGASLPLSGRGSGASSNGVTSGPSTR
jgi:hypothetical protein